MTTIQSILPITRQAIEALSQSKSEPAWLAKDRLEAFQLAGKLELPKLEKTNIKRWDTSSYGEYKEAAQIDSIAQLPKHLRDLLPESNQDNIIVQQNSNVVFNKISEELAAQGVIFMSLEEAASKHSEIVEKHYMKAIKKDENQLTALHAAIWSGGVFLYVPRNVEVTIPMQALFYVNDDQALFSPHVLIVAEENSSVTYVDNFLSDTTAKSQVQNGAVEVFAGAGAKVNYVSIHNLDEQITDLNYRRAVLQNDAKINWVVGEMNYGNSMSDTNSILAGAGSDSEAFVICVASGEQQLSITTYCTHIGRNTTSDMQTRAVMKDRSRAILNGITKMEKGATNANGEQTERVLMLSPDARGDANPMLLIDEDDVLAGHAASAGQVDPLDLYYLMSRGIEKDLAVSLIVYGFLAPVINSVPLEHVEEQFRQLVKRKLDQ